MKIAPSIASAPLVSNRWIADTQLWCCRVLVMNFPFQLLPSALIVLFTLKAQSGRQTRHGLEILTGAVQRKGRKRKAE
jgi:hypothetical protein